MTVYEALLTEQSYPGSHELDALDTQAALQLMNEAEDAVTAAIDKALPQIGAFIDRAAPRLAKGRLVYIGAGTSGRLGVLDASECPPTFGVSPDLVVGVMAGGDHALRYSVEGAEDDGEQAVKDLAALDFNQNDSLVAISASGSAAYCLSALRYAKQLGALTAALVMNTGSTLAAEADVAMEVVTGREVLLGSTRLKSGSATKRVLNMITTLIMVRRGKVYRNLMVDMTPSNRKLRDRARRLVQMASDSPLTDQAANQLLERAGYSAKAAIVMNALSVDLPEAQAKLAAAEGHVRAALLTQTEGATAPQIKGGTP